MITIAAYEMAHDEFEASAWREAPTWTKGDCGTTRYGGRRRLFALEGGWRASEGIWRRPKRHRSQRPRVTSYGSLTSSNDFGEPLFDPLHAPALPAIVECPCCKARLVADAGVLDVASPDEDTLVPSGREPTPLGKVAPYMTKPMDDYVEEMAAEHYANRDDSGFDDEPLENDPQR